MYKYFDNIPLDNEEISEERVQSIKTSVLSRVKEEKAMSKHTTIKTVTFAVVAAATVALSAIIASAEQSWTVATDVEETLVEEVSVEEAPEVAVDKNTDEEKVNEKGIDWTVYSDGDDYLTYVAVHPADDPDVYYYYYKISDEQLKEMVGDGWTIVVGEDVNAIHQNEVFVTD